jgi:Flp pilus assembly protein TadG
MFSRIASAVSTLLPAPLVARVRSFQEDTSGGIAVMFALMFVMLAIFVGAAVDLGRWSQTRSQTISAMDAAVLAGGRVLQLNEHDVEGARAAAALYYAENTRDRTPVVEDTITFDVTDDNIGFQASGNAYLQTTFLSLAHIPRLPLFASTEAQYSKAQFKAGGNSNSDVEIAMMLDVTGSMKDTKTTQKITALKSAATKLVETVIMDSAAANFVRVAIVPFAEGVRLPANAVSTAVGTPPKIVKKTSGSGKNQKTILYNRSEHCVVERPGSNSYTDVAPGSGNYVLPYRDEVASILTSDGTVKIDNSTTKTEGAAADFTWASGGKLSQSEKTKLKTAATTFASCPLSSADELVPLTNDKEVLKNKIAGLALAGSTAGQIGTAWAWYTLSPNWNALWGADSAAAEYGNTTRKIAILMTDGAYNLQYDKDGIGTGSTGSGSAVNASSTTQARLLCTGMKAAGITVYTVGFALGSNESAIETMNQCATDPSKAYTPEDANALEQAFLDIALKINELYLTH